MVKITCQSISNVKVDVEVNLTDTVSVLKDKIVEQGKAPADANMKFIYKGGVMIPTDPLSKYDIVDGSSIVFMVTKPKKVEPVQEQVSTESKVVQPTSNTSNTPNTPNTSTASNVLPIPNPNAVNATTTTATNTAPIATSFHGLSINMMRQFSVPAVLAEVLSNKQLFLEILQKNQQAATIRAADPAGFDAIILHPDFLPQGSVRLDGSDGHDHGDIDGDGDGDGEGTEYGTGANPVSAGSTMNAINSLGLTNEDKTFLKELMTQMAALGVQSSLEEIIGVYIACDKDKDQTVALLMNQFS